MILRWVPGSAAGSLRQHHRLGGGRSPSPPWQLRSEAAGNDINQTRTAKSAASRTPASALNIAGRRGAQLITHGTPSQGAPAAHDARSAGRRRSRATSRMFPSDTQRTPPGATDPGLPAIPAGRDVRASPRVLTMCLRPYGVLRLSLICVPPECPAKRRRGRMTGGLLVPERRQLEAHRGGRRARGGYLGSANMASREGLP
jgi:hypothetical protein